MRLRDTRAKDQVRIRCVALDITVRLPLWPEEVTHILPSWNVSTLDRPRRQGLDVPSTLTTEEFSLGFTMRNETYEESVEPLIRDLARIAKADAPVQLLMGKRATGLWRIEAPEVTETAWAADDTPSVVDVSLVLKRASDATINVGLARRIRGTATGVSRQR